MNALSQQLLAIKAALKKPNSPAAAVPATSPPAPTSLVLAELDDRVSASDYFQRLPPDVVWSIISFHLPVPVLDDRLGHGVGPRGWTQDPAEAAKLSRYLGTGVVSQ
jgi:hypothetical protein